MIYSTQPQEEVIDVAVQGTENVLQSVAAHGEGVRRVILTSATGAAHPAYGPDALKETPITTEDWNEESSIANGGAYLVSKASNFLISS